MQKICIVKLILFSLLLSNFSALAQKTNIWIVMHAETADSTVADSDPGLTVLGLARAKDLMTTLKREKLQAIYIDTKKAANSTVMPLVQKVKLLQRVYTDSVKILASKILKNFQGNNVLVVARHDALIPFIQALGIVPPFATVNSDDNDLLFSITFYDNSDKIDLYISHYGKPHHSTEIPREYMMENYYPSFMPSMGAH